VFDRESVRRLVLSRPIPDALIRDIGRLPLVRYVRRYRGGSDRIMLTPQLYETLKLAAGGATTPQIAETLGISESAASESVKRLLAYFDVPNRTALAAKCYRERIV
jgi:DNA-binding CsgD family transcriptional regulator